MKEPEAAAPEALRFAVTWDYRCPFARNAHEHIITALETGAPFEVTFVPFSLSEMHVEDGAPSAFDDPDEASGLLAMQAALVVRDRLPDMFLRVHRALFSLRHDSGGDLREIDELRTTLDDAGVDADFVFSEVASGWPLDTFRKEHDAAERDHEVWGVPTFIVGDQAAFVRVMTRPDGSGVGSRQVIERIVSLLTEMPELNEFKHTSVSN